MTDGTVALPDGRTVGYRDFGPPGGAPVLVCHGGPGNRLQAAVLAAGAAPHGIRVVGIDRPGYGLSSPRPGRTIADFVPDALAAADRLGIRAFHALGVSTGGAYALALAALAPDRVLGVVTQCAMTDMRDPASRASMGEVNHAVWGAASRGAAIAEAERVFGADGSGMRGLLSTVPLAPADLEALAALASADPAALQADAAASFAHGVQGYVDDRLADGPGWVSFDAAAVRCPVAVVHGDADAIVPLLQAEHTAALVPHAELRVVPGGGHFSVSEGGLAALVDLVRQQAGSGRGA
ncbi:Alpha/Beta hydrolase protein [Hyaloraphidium curvatum]|nr:Alpha/Beta hydrolase protein [Hyaloraphidium curvatum]